MDRVDLVLPLENVLPAVGASGLTWAAEWKHQRQGGGCRCGTVEVGDTGVPGRIPMDPCFLIGEMKGGD